MQKLLISLLAVFAIFGVSFAQEDTETPVRRSLSIYLDVISGHLTEMPDKNAKLANAGEGRSPKRLFEGNEFEFGINYSQNFATVPWLSMWFKALVVTGNNPASESNGDFAGNTGGAYGLLPWGLPRVQLGVNLGGYSIFALDTRGILANCNFYTVDLGTAGAFTFLTILEFWAVPLARANYEALGLYKHNVLDLFALRVDYGVSFAEKWRFTTKVAFRFGSDASATAFKESFHIRWENQILVSVTDKFYMWTQLRYNIANIASAVFETDHQLQLQAGLAYTFDLSAL